MPKGIGNWPTRGRWATKEIESDTLKVRLRDGDVNVFDQEPDGRWRAVIVRGDRVVDLGVHPWHVMSDVVDAGTAELNEHDRQRAALETERKTE